MISEAGDSRVNYNDCRGKGQVMMGDFFGRDKVSSVGNFDRKVCDDGGSSRSGVSGAGAGAGVGGGGKKIVSKKGREEKVNKENFKINQIFRGAEARSVSNVNVKRYGIKVMPKVGEYKSDCIKDHFFSENKIEAKEEARQASFMKKLSTKSIDIPKKIPRKLSAGTVLAEKILSIPNPKLPPNKYNPEDESSQPERINANKGQINLLIPRPMKYFMPNVPPDKIMPLDPKPKPPPKSLKPDPTPPAGLPDPETHQTRINPTVNNGFDPCTPPNPSNLQTWTYLTDKKFRSYQFSITETCLFHNTLVSLPTGLGKTFIAANIINNYHNWYPSGKIFFLAPTKPLVKQQISCIKQIKTIPKDLSIELTGEFKSSDRYSYYQQKKIFFMTPQT